MNILNKKLTPHERAVLWVLENSKIKRSTTFIAETGRMCWMTARRVLYKLEKEGLVKKERQGKRVYWWISEKENI